MKNGRCTTGSDPKDDISSDSDNNGLIIGLVLGLLVLILIIAYYMYRRHQRAKSSDYYKTLSGVI
jgi:hypothetical protein